MSATLALLTAQRRSLGASPARADHRCDDIANHGRSPRPAFLDLVGSAAAIIFTVPKDNTLTGATRCIKLMGLLHGDTVKMHYRRLDFECTRTKTEAVDRDLARYG